MFGVTGHPEKSIPRGPDIDGAGEVQHLSRLFRHSLRAGQIHPLLQVMRRRAGLQGGVQVALTEAPLRRPAEPSVHIDANLLRQKIVRLPSLPQAVLDVMRLLASENATTAQITARIERDQALTARTLRIANSAFYGVPGRVATIHTAIGILGLRTVATLFTTAAVSAQFTAAACPEFEFGRFWRHAIATALMARALAQQLRMDEDVAFTAGLLHDIGRLAMATQFPAETGQVLHYAREADLPPLEVEQQLLNTDHVAVGVLIATHWHFPPAVIDAIERHHAPEKSKLPSIADVVHAADALAHALDPSSSEDEMVPPVDLSAWVRLDLTATQCLVVLESTAAGVAGLCEALSL